MPAAITNVRSVGSCGPRICSPRSYVRTVKMAATRPTRSGGSPSKIGVSLIAWTRWLLTVIGSLLPPPRTVSHMDVRVSRFTLG